MATSSNTPRLAVGDGVTSTGAVSTAATSDSAIAIRPAQRADWPAIEELLRRCVLPLDGAREHWERFCVANAKDRIVGCAGWEHHGAFGLLRSVAVDPGWQRAGVGRVLIDRILSDAKHVGVEQIYLLTTTAAGYFERIGFVHADRAAAPVALHRSAEFQGACPASATLMVLPLLSLLPSLPAPEPPGSPRAGIRFATAEDAGAITAIYAPVVTNTFISFELQPPTVEEMRSRIASTSPQMPWLVSLDEFGGINAYAYASKHRERAAYQWSADTTIYVREDARGMGVGKRLYQRLIDELTALGYYQAFAGIALPNAASVALHESIGFTPVGVFRDVGYKLGAWHDVGWWQRALRTGESPAAPLPCSRRDGTDCNAG